MKRLVRTVCAAGLVLMLAACSEKPQTAGTPKQDQQAYAGTGVAAFTAPGWSPGDKTGWASAQKARQQYGQNEYNRTTAAADVLAPAVPSAKSSTN